MKPSLTSPCLNLLELVSPCSPPPGASIARGIGGFDGLHRLCDELHSHLLWRE